MTLTLGLRPRQRHGKVQAESVTSKSHLHSQMDSHFGNWKPYGVPNFQRDILGGQNSLD